MEETLFHDGAQWSELHATSAAQQKLYYKCFKSLVRFLLESFLSGGLAQNSF